MDGGKAGQTDRWVGQWRDLLGQAQLDLRFAAIKPHFWFGKPELLLECCRFSLFLSALAAAELIFYPWQAQIHRHAKLCPHAPVP